MRFRRTAVMAATSLFSAMTILPSFVGAQTLPNGVIPNGGGKTQNTDANPNGDAPQKKGPGAGPKVERPSKPNPPPNMKVEKRTPNVGGSGSVGGNGGPGGNAGQGGGGNADRGGGGNKKFGGAPTDNAPVKAPKVKTPDKATTPTLPNNKVQDSVTTPTKQNLPHKRDKTPNPVVINPGAGGNSPSKGAEGGTPKIKTPTDTTRDTTSGPKSFDRDDKRPPVESKSDRPERNVATGKPAKSFEELKRTRTEKTFGGGKGVVIEEADKRKIFKSGNTVVIQHDETERLRRVAPNARFQKGNGGVNISIIERPGNIRIYNETDSNGQLIRRYRRGPDGRDAIIIDNRRRKHNFGKDIAIGIGVVAGAAILNSFLDLPPPRVTIPRERYIVDYERASDDEIYEALSAPPIEDIRESYSLDEIRATVALRDRMRRVDLDDITFEFGSFEVDPSQYGKLDRIARAMQRVIDRNPNEVFMVEGYTDAVGSREDNLSLSDRRAESVAEVLTREFRIPYENLTTQGYGEDFLKVPSDGPERVNRRVAVRRITPLLSSNDRPPPPASPSNYEQRGDVQDPQNDDRGYDDRGPPPDDQRDGPPGQDDRGPPPDDRGSGGNSGGGYQYSPYRGGDRPN